MSETGHPQFQRLWPTLFYAMTLPGSDKANPVLQALLLEQDTKSDDLTVQYLTQDLFGLSHPAIQWLRQCCLQAVCDYAVEAGMDYRPEVDLQAWVNINRRGDYHNLHNHPHSWLSGTYYVQTPKGCSGLKFEDPRLDRFMAAPPRKAGCRPENQPWITIPAKAGNVVLFESWMRHEVPINQRRTERISISFNYNWF